MTTGDNIPSEVSPALAASILQAALDCIIVIDQHSRVVEWNGAAEKTFGYTRTDAIGKAIADLIIPPSLREAHYTGVAHYLNSAKGPILNQRIEVPAMRCGGEEFPVELTVVPVDEVPPRFAAYVRDLTQRKRWEEELQAANDKMRRIAEALQHSLLMVPPPDAFPGITVKALYEAASDDTLVGGDFFDVFALSEDKVALVVGDATGHGITAVTSTAEAKFALRVFLRECSSPADALRRLSTFIADRSRLDPLHRGGSYLALAACVLDTRTGELVCAQGGIEPPFVVRAATGDVVELTECYGPLLGVDTGGEAISEFCHQRVTLTAGDVLALSSDGLTEARRGRGRKREFFGYDGLVKAVREEVIVRSSSLTEVGPAVLRQAKDFTGGTLTDDVCLLLVRWYGTES